MTHATLYSSEVRPAILPPVLDNIPAELKAVPRWVLWRLEWRGAWSKVPYSPDGRRAKSNDSATWATFEEVTSVDGYDGIGFMLGDGWCGIDLDDCRDPETGKLTRSAKSILRRVNTYCEVSPSGTGVKLFGRGCKGTDQTRFDGAEIYDSNRYFCVTGQDGCREVSDISDAVQSLESELGSPVRSVAVRREFVKTHKAHVAAEPDTPEFHRAYAAALGKLIREWYGEEALSQAE